MLSINHCKRILESKAQNYTDSEIEEIRDALYVAANLAFSHWQKNCSSTKAGEPSPLFVGEQPTPVQAPAKGQQAASNA